MPIAHRHISWILIALCTTIAIVVYCNLPWWTVDDAYISYRYGKNLVAVGELNWNVGEPKVEGYTGIFLPLLASGLLALGLPMIHAIKVLGILALAFTLFLAYKMMGRLGVSEPRRMVAILFLASTPLLYLHSISGLETIFFLAFMTWTFSALANPEALFTTGEGAYGLSFALLLSGICRPEGMALLGLVLIQVLISKNKFKPFIFKQLLLKIVGLSFIPLVGYWVWRSCYYDSLLPNSYHAKTYHGIVNLESVLVAGKFLGYYLFIPALASLVLRMRGQKVALAPQKLFLGTALGFFICCMVAYAHSHLWMNYGSRFFVPFLPIGVVVMAYLSGSQADSLPRWKMGVLAALLFLQLGILGFRFKQEWAFLNYYHAIVRDELEPIGKELKEKMPADSKVISFMDAGAIGYFSGLKLIDFGRLNDPYLARNTLSQGEINAYFFAQDADVVVMSSAAANAISYIDEAMGIVSDPRFKQFEEVGVWGNHAEYPYWQHVFMKVLPSKFTIP